MERRRLLIDNMDAQTSIVRFSPANAPVDTFQLADIDRHWLLYDKIVYLLIQIQQPISED